MTKAFDTAQFVPAAAPTASEAVEVVSGGGSSPLKTDWATFAKSAPGVTVGASVPAATAQGLALTSGPGPGFAWTPLPSTASLPAATGPGQTYVSGTTSPWPMGLAPAMPAPTAQNQIPLASASLGWGMTTPTQIVTQGGAVTNAGGGSFVASADLIFTPSTGETTRIDGGDPSKSALDNFTIDAGTF